AGRAHLIPLKQKGGTEMAASYVIIGIHGLANKPPADVLEEGWCKALVEGLKRNEGRTAGADGLSFRLVYWGDWNYSHPIRPEDNPEPYIPAEGTGPLPAYGDNYWDTLRAEATEMADRPIGQPLYKVNPGDTEQSALVSSR
ncbi:MAG: hypothetical protein P8Y25_06445, partial [Chromatiaceae bacterium]